MAISLAQRAVALEPFDAAILDTLANTLYDLGRVDEAIEVQTAAVAFLDEYARDDGITERLSRYKSGRK